MARLHDVLDDYTGHALDGGEGLTLTAAVQLARTWTARRGKHAVVKILDRTSGQYVQRWKGGERIPTKPRKWLNE